MPLLLLAACAVSDDDLVELSELESEAAIHWTDDASISNHSSDRQVALTYYGGRTYMVHTAAGSTQLRWSRFSGTGWSTPQNLVDQLSDQPPSLATFNNRPTLVYKQAGSNRFRMSTYFDGVWTAPVTAGAALGLTTITSGPSLAVHEGALLMAYCRDMGSYDRVQLDRFDGSAWSSLVSYSLPVDQVCKHVAIASLPGNRFDLVLHKQIRFYNNGTAYYDDFMSEITGVGTPTASWAQQGLPQRTKKPISIVHCNGTTHMVHGGYTTPSEIWWADRNSSGWGEDERIPNQASAGGSALACHGTRTLMVHNGGYPQLWWAEYIE